MSRKVLRGKGIIKINGKCSFCGFVHKHTTTIFYKIQGKNSRYAQCINCKNILPYKIEGCICTEDKNDKISIGDCSVHAWLKKTHRQS